MEPIIENKTAPDTARWDALAEKFRAAKTEAPPLPVTLCAELPLCEEGERVGPLRRFLRRLVRRAARWYAAPLLAQQNRVNRALRGELEELRRRVEALEGEQRP